MSSESPKNPLREWQESAPYWATHADTVRLMFGPITSALIEAARIKDSHLILDVAGGAGEPTMTIAQATSSANTVVFTDAIFGMVATSRNQARERHLANVEFAQCVGEALPFSASSFDVIVSRLGVMLFNDPLAALKEMMRVAKPEGRIALAVWGPRDLNPFFQLVADVVARYVESPPEDPDAPGAFRFASSDKLARLLRDSGAGDVTERVFDFTLEAPITPRQFWQVRSELSDTLREKIATLSTSEVSRVAQEVEEAGRAFYEDGRMKLPARVLIVSGVRS